MVAFPQAFHFGHEERTVKYICTRAFRLLLVLALSIYVASYMVLSRKAFAYSKKIGIDGFWFVVPLTEETRRQNDFRNMIFWPAVQIDHAIGTGMKRLCNPMIEMSGPDTTDSEEDAQSDVRH